MSITIYRAGDLYNHPRVKRRKATPKRPAVNPKPARKGLLNVGKSFFYEVIEPQLERVPLGDRAIGYTERSVNQMIEERIKAAAAERAERKLAAEGAQITAPAPIEHAKPCKRIAQARRASAEAV
jgi:hypothetical protein